VACCRGRCRGSARRVRCAPGDHSSHLVWSLRLIASMPSSAPNVRRTPPRAPAAPAHARRADLLARLFSCRIPDPVVARWLSVSLRVWVCLCAVGTGVWGCRYCRGFSHEHIFVAATLPIQHDAPATHHTHPKVQEKCSAGSAQKGKQTQPIVRPEREPVIPERVPCLAAAVDAAGPAPRALCRAAHLALMWYA